jgi:hypothetical protein
VGGGFAPWRAPPPLPWSGVRANLTANHRLDRNLRQLATEVDTLEVVSVGAATADFLDALYGFTRLWREKLLGKEEFDLLCESTDEGAHS